MAARVDTGREPAALASVASAAGFSKVRNPDAVCT